MIRNSDRFSALAAMIVMALTLVSCGASYSIKGSTDITEPDGTKVMLHTYGEEKMLALDSCDVLHGSFALQGTMDSVRLGIISYGEANVPVILEKGDISVRMNENSVKVEGTPLNEKLDSFIVALRDFDERQYNIDRRQRQGILDNANMDSLEMKLMAELEQLNGEQEKFVTGFMEKNFGNALGPAVFFLITMDNAFPQMNAWIESLMIKAKGTPFATDPYVRFYVETARKNEAIDNGTADLPMAAPPADPNPDVPTASELAKPKE